MSTGLEFSALTDVTRSYLDNGLELVIAPRQSAPLVCVMLWYHSGAAAERQGAGGTAHLLEHMMFKGSARFAKGEIDRQTQRHGGRNNAFTSHDSTCYHFIFAPRFWHLALEIEVDRMTALRLDEEEFALEREVVIQELHEDLDSPWGKLEQELEALLFSGHPYGRPIIGWYDELAALTTADLREYQTRHYHPANATLVIAGGIDPTEAHEVVQATFATIAAGPRAAATAIAPPPVLGIRRSEIVGTNKLARLQLAFRAPAWGEPDHLPLLLAASLLAHGKSSRLYRRLVVTERLTRGVGAGCDVRRASGAFRLWCDIKPGFSAERAEVVLLEELARLATEPPTTEELERARTQLDCNLLYQIEHTEGWGELLGRHATLGDVMAIETQRQRLRQLDAAAVSAALVRQLTPAHRCVALATPSSS
jgi:zinc protease